MSNVRPWFRLSSIARPTSQASSDPPPPPQPRQTTRRPVVVRTPAKQPSPPRQRQPLSPPRQRPSPPRQRAPPSPPRQRTPPSPPRQRTPPQERSPYHSPPSRHMSPPTPPKAASPSPPTPPPRWSYTPPPPSLKEVQEAFPPRKPTSPPSPAHSTRSVKTESETSRKAPSPRVLSPYSLPPPQLHETTQKNILTAEKTNQLQEPNHHNHNHNHNHNHQGNNTRKTPRQPSYSESEHMMRSRVITIAGENKGAVMEIIRSPSSNKTGGAGTHPSRGFHGTGEKGRKLQSSSSSSSDEGEGKKKTMKNKNANNSNLPMKAFINSNVQMINNSIVYNSTATHHDPGVHLKISRTPGSDNGFHVKDYMYGKSGGGYTN